MKIIQQDFKVTSKLWFLICISCLPIGVMNFLEDHSTPGRFIFNLVVGMAITWLLAYGSYQFSFTYEFKQKELVAYNLFKFWKKETYAFRNLKKIEITGIGESLDEIHLYFESERSKTKLVISKYQVNLGKVKLFLFANVENFEDIIVEN